MYKQNPCLLARADAVALNIQKVRFACMQICLYMETDVKHHVLLVIVLDEPELVSSILHMCYF